MQPLSPHAHWHIDVSYLNLSGIFYYLCSILDGCNRYIVHHEIREQMTEQDVEIIVHRLQMPHRTPSGPMLRADHCGDAGDVGNATNPATEPPGRAGRGGGKGIGIICNGCWLPGFCHPWYFPVLSSGHLWPSSRAWEREFNSRWPGVSQPTLGGVMSKRSFLLPLVIALGFSTPGFAASTSATCFNPDLYKKGTKVKLVYALSGKSGKGTLTFKSKVNGKKKFNGRKVTEVASTSVTKVDGKTSKTAQKTYISASTKKKIEYFHGNVVKVASTNGSTTITSKIKPPQQDRFNLKRKKSYTQRVKQTTKTTTVTKTPAGNFKNSTNSSGLIKHSKKFLGMSKVKVPAGTFSTCRFQIIDKTTIKGKTSTSRSTSWISAKSGLEVMNRSGTSLIKLKKGTLNGKKVR